MKPKWITFILTIAFIWLGAVLFYELPEKPLFAYMSWITAGLLLLATFGMVIKDMD